MGGEAAESQNDVPAGQRMLRLLSLAAVGFVSTLPCLAALQTFSKLDQIWIWVIERKISASGEPHCRALIPSGGAWFEANVHLSADGALVIPDGVAYAGTPQDLVAAREALERCRVDVLYLP